MVIALESKELREKILANPKRILNIAKNMGANVRHSEKLFDALMNDFLSADEWHSKLEEMIDLTSLAIIESLRAEFKKQGLGEFDVEKYFLRAMLQLKQSTPDSIKKAQESIKRAKTEAKRLQSAKKETLKITLEIEAMLKEAKEQNKARSPRNEYQKIAGGLKETLKVLDSGNYELALYMAKRLSKEAENLKDIKLIALRNAAKAGHVVSKVKGEDPGSLPSNALTKLNTFLSTIKYLLEEEDYQTATLLAREVKCEAEKFLPPDKVGISKYVCPICFDLNCPNVLCNLSISPSPLARETCRTYCTCGMLYHICCVQKGAHLTCVSCLRPLKG
ncbi:MAG: hypothetical protein JSW00_15175 [Thermoplasmata archaeon]|nr:MAG: hypothetical protein JSW00_15175 [Thermoplasmata archaeon]